MRVNEVSRHTYFVSNICNPLFCIVNLYAGLHFIFEYLKYLDTFEDDDSSHLICHYYKNELKSTNEEVKRYTI